MKQLFQPAHAGEERRGSAGRPGRSNSVPVVASPLSDPTVVLGAFQWKVSLDALPPPRGRENLSVTGFSVIGSWQLSSRKRADVEVLGAREVFLNPAGRGEVELWSVEESKRLPVPPPHMDESGTGSVGLVRLSRFCR